MVAKLDGLLVVGRDVGTLVVGIVARFLGVIVG